MIDYQACRSLGMLFFEQAAKHPDKPFLWSRIDGRWTPQSWSRVEARISLLSRGLRALGVEAGDRVVIVSENRPAWLVAEIAILAAGAIAVPAYVTNTTDDHLHILENSDARAAIISTRKLAERFLPAAHRAASCKFVVAMEDPKLAQDVVGVSVHLWDDVMAMGASQPDDVRELAARGVRSDIAVIIHTSGTGGAPKGVMLSHGAILHNCEGAATLIGDEIRYGQETFLSFLPLSHSYEHMAGQFFPISIAAEIYYAQGIESLLGNMAEVRPTIMTAVPRLYETIYQRIERAREKNTGLRRFLFERALAIGTKRYHDPASLSLGERLLDRLLERLVRSKVRARFGGRLKFFVSGGAPLNPDIGIYFTALGVTILQGYGQTESAPLISCNSPDRIRMDTVGRLVANTEVRIAADGEILVRGELVMDGYFGDPEATASVVQDGWLHTGDIGELDDEGFLSITDRKKDLIVSSGGDNIAPQRIESLLSLQPEIQQAVVFGDRRPYLVGMIVPDPEFLDAWAGRNNRPADLAVVADDSGLHKELTAVLERVNAELSLVERVRRFVVPGEVFSVDNGLMTPTMKLRRHAIRELYGDRIESLYR